MSKPVILLVDDDKTVLDSLNNQLRSAFHREVKLENASNPSEAMEILEELDGQVHLIISDWMMPTEKGDQFLIRVTERWPAIPQIMLSGFADEESVERARSGAHLAAYLTKPWSANEVIALVRQHMLTPAG
jgi:CheY-like chemotaxis protein